jgi:ribonuclease HIII
LAPEGDVEKLRDMGVRDGKLITDKRILALDEVLRRDYPHAIVVIDPPQYNERYKVIKNLNKLLAACHADAIEQVCNSNEVDLAISDKFGKSELIEGELRKRDISIPLRQIVRGERFMQVAAASILARAAFLHAMKKLSGEYGMEIPRGAAAKVDVAGRELVRLFGPEVLPRVAKTHFKNCGRALSTTLML